MKPRSALIVEKSSGVVKEIEAVVTKRRAFEKIISAESPDQAILTAGTLEPDLVIYDLPLEGNADFGTIKRIRAILPEAVIIAISLYEYYRTDSLQAGADDFVLKTDPGNALEMAIYRHRNLAPPTQ